MPKEPIKQAYKTNEQIALRGVLHRARSIVQLTDAEAKALNESFKREVVTLHKEPPAAAGTPA